MNIKNNLSLQHKLAAEYVLGTLRGGARRRFGTWLKEDAQLQQRVREWQAHLMPMVEFSSSSVPDGRVWKQIESLLQIQLGGQFDQGRTAFLKFLDSLNFWRGLSLAASAAVLVLAVLVLKPGESNFAQDNYVATLSDEKSQAVAVISSDVKRHELLVRFVNRPDMASIAKGKSLELWSISKAGKVRSLGLLATDQTEAGIRVSLPEGIGVDTPDLLAVSLEPIGGSGNPEKPSGPILFKGNWLKLG